MAIKGWTGKKNVFGDKESDILERGLHIKSRPSHMT
jgi:hypothetical protein